VQRECWVASVSRELAGVLSHGSRGAESTLT